jgi:hypothetical protein
MNTVFDIVDGSKLPYRRAAFSRPDGSTTALPALWPITELEKLSLFDARNGSPREHGFLKRLPRPSRCRSCPRRQAICVAEIQPAAPILAIGERRGEEIWSARVTLKYRALAVRLADEYIWFWIGEQNVNDHRFLGAGEDARSRLEKGPLKAAQGASSTGRT